MKKTLFFAIFLLPLLLVAQQEPSPLRLEFEAPFEGPCRYSATPIESKGFILTYPTDQSTEDSANLAVVLYNTAMTALSVQQLNIPQFTEFVDAYLEGDKLHFLYLDQKLATENSTWILLTYYLEENRFTTQVTPAYFIKTPSFKVKDQYLIATYEWEGDADFVIYDLERNGLLFVLDKVCNTKKVEIEFLEFDSRAENSILLAGGYNVKGEMYKKSRRLPFNHTGYQKNRNKKLEEKKREIFYVAKVNK